MTRLPLSISIISLNEEDNLRRCLASVGDLAQEIVIVDSGSKDRTAEIAAEFGATFVHQDWLGYTAQKNHCLGLCSQPWILALDCDEELTPALRESIQRFFANGDDQRFDGAWMSRLVWFMGRWIHHGDWYPDRKVRLFRREKSRWAADGGGQVHERLDVDGPCTTLSGDLLHYSFKNIQHYLVKHVQYSNVFLQTQQSKGGRWSLLHTLFRPWWRFTRAYVLKRGFMDGFPGLWIAVATAFFTFDRYSRMYENEAEEGAKS
ncbi:MAG: glycosyltransferase family 2 protein [Prosthecobacter sp.]|uniref:glycosyltransferase family 2 protein n=1 Tax=Prosthecobacter sp. TaxID=1965333 RepID=UPI0026273806|nr:glycosyltransferase family 2 protein [Prosthecobacter sp.]MCF7790151.1 glycosyltransferase family 2 protein [Prosthecobacter sp.]